MASGKNLLTVYIEVEEEKGQEDKKEEKDNKEDDTKAEEKNELDSENLEVVSEDEEELEKEEEEEEGRKTTRHKGTIAAMVVLKIFGLAFFINYLVNVAGQEAFDSCSVPGEKRQACGSWSTSERECLDMGCCYRSPFGVPNAPWCYQKASEKETNNWFLPSSSEEDSSEEMDPDRDTAVDLGSILDWMMGNTDDKPSGNEDTEDPPASPHHSPHHRSPDDDHTQHRAPDRHGLMPPNLHRDPSNPNCDNPLHRGDSGNPPRYPAPESPHHAPNNPPHHAPETPHHGIPESPPNPEPDRGSTHDHNPPPPRHDPKPSHHESHPQPASGRQPLPRNHPPPTKTRPPHHKEPKQKTPLDCHHDIMCALVPMELGEDVINAYPEDPKVAAIYRDLAWSIPVLFVVMLILCTCLCSCNCCGLTKPPPDYVEQLESDSTGDEKGPPATFAVEAEVEGNEKAPPVVYVEAGDYEDPWSTRVDAVMSPAQLKQLMANIQQENIIKG